MAVAVEVDTIDINVAGGMSKVVADGSIRMVTHAPIARYLHSTELTRMSTYS